MRTTITTVRTYFYWLGHWLPQLVATTVYYHQNISVHGITALHWPNEASDAEGSETAQRSSANRPPPPGEGGPLEAPPGSKTLLVCVFASFPISRGSKLRWPVVIKTEQIKGKIKNNACIVWRCCDDLPLSSLLAKRFR